MTLPVLVPRKIEIDRVKAIAIFGVLLIHASAGALVENIGSSSWFGALFWGSVSRASVPLFFMCTGALMLDPERSCSLRRILTHNLPRLFAALFFWAAMYQLYHMTVGGDFSSARLLQAAKELLLFRHESHLYYLHIAVLIYLCIPLLHVFTAHASRRQLAYALLVWFACGIVYPTLRHLWPLSLLGGIPSQYALNMTWASMGYCLLGHFLLRFPLQKRFLFPVLCLVGFCMVFGSTLTASMRAGTLQTRYLEGMSIGVCVMAAGIFGTVCRGTGRTRTDRIAGILSRASFCVYLSHMVFLSVLRHWGLSASLSPAVLSIPAAAFLTLLCSLLLWLVLHRIPFIRTWLI